MKTNMWKIATFGLLTILLMGAVRTNHSIGRYTASLARGGMMVIVDTTNGKFTKVDTHTAPCYYYKDIQAGKLERKPND